MLLRDNASNGVKACNDWGVAHFGCVAHCLHLIVGPFLLCSKKEEEEVMEAAATAAAAAAEVANREQQPTIIDVDNSNGEAATDEESDDDGDIGGFEDPFSDDDEMNVKRCRVVVNKIRTIVKFFHKSSKASAKLKDYNEGERCDLVLDVRTRWNSTDDMLENFLSNKQPVSQFLFFVSTDEGAAIFGNKIPILTPTEWALMSGLHILLEPFKKVTRDLSGNSYPSFSFAVPSLLNMQKELNSRTLFREWTYQGPDRLDVLEMLESCQRTVLESTKARLERMVFQDGELVWVTYLDPRFRDGFIIDDELTPYQKDVALARLRDEAIALAQFEMDKFRADQARITAEAATEGHPTVPQPQSPPRPKKKSRPSLFDTPPAPTNEDSDDDMEIFDRNKIRLAVKSEMEFFGRTVVGSRKKIDPLGWWHEHGHEYPNLARVARKWLGVCATSTASERVFSSCGLALNAKRTKLNGTTLEAQVKLKYNLPYCGMSIDEIAQAL